MTILITGAFGFVGKNLSAYLAEKGHEVWALDVAGVSSKVLKCERSKVGSVARQDAEPQRGAYTRCYDWGQLAEIPWGGVDAVVHLAGKAHDTRNASEPQSYFDVNVGLTKKVICSLVHYGESALVEKPEAGGQRPEIGFDSTNELTNSRTNELPKFILFSSVKAVADRVEGVLTEDVEPDPQTPYGKSKLEAEKVVRSSFVRYCESALVVSPEGGSSTTNEQMNSRTNELNYYILRPCMIHGPGNKGNLNLLYTVIRKGFPWPLGAFENRRSFASIGNVCAVVDGLLKGGVEPGVYQVADDEALATNALIGVIAETLGRRARIWKIPCGWVRALAHAGDILRLPLNSERLKKLTESYVVSNAKVKRALGLEQMPVGAREGLRKTLESFSCKAAED